MRAYITRALQFGLGHLRLPPRDVWSMTVIEHDAAWRGYLEAKGVSTEPFGMTRSRLEELKQLYPDT